MKRYKSEKYKQFLDGMDLMKTADDGNQTVNELINQEAYSQLSKKYPDLVPYILGIKDVENIDDNTILSSAIVSNGEVRLIIPIIYAAGKVDATSYIYNPDADIMFALTKKVVNFILGKNKSLGNAVSATNVNFDSGNIRKLFIPPKTWSPKIANSNFLPQIVEAYPEVKIALLEKLSNDSFFAEAFEKAYGDFAEVLKKEASAINAIINSEPVVVTTRQELVENDKLLDKEAALKEYIENGIYIQHGRMLPNKTLVKKSSLQSKLNSVFNGEELEVINKETGCVLGVDSITYLQVPMLSLPVYGSKYSHPVLIDIMFDNNFKTLEFESFVGKSDDKCTALNKAVDVTPQNLISLLPNLALVLMDGQKPLGFIPVIIPFSTINKIQLIDDKGDRYVLNIGIGSVPHIDKIIILKNSDRKPLQVGNVITIGDKNIKLYPCKVDPRRLLTFKEYSIGLRDTDNQDNLIKVSYDRGTFYINSTPTSASGLAQTLLSQGVDKNSIYSLIKEAKDNGSVEVKAISSKIDMLANMLMNAVGEIKKVEDKVKTLTERIDGTAGQNATVQEDDLGQDMQTDSQEQYGEVSDPMNSNESLIATQNEAGAPQLDPETQAAIAMQAQQGAETPPMFSLEDNSAPDQTPDMQQIGIAAPTDMAANNEQSQQGLIDGVNPLANPDVVETLLQLKDSPVMDTSFLSVILSDKNVSLVIQDQLQNIVLGITGLGKIVFNIQLNYNSLSGSMGDSKYKSVLNNMKSLFKKMTDMYVDMVQKSEQYNAHSEES